MSSELQIFLSEIFLYFQKKRGFSSPRILYRKIRVFSSAQKKREKIPLREILYRKIRVLKMRIFLSEIFLYFRKKRTCTFNIFKKKRGFSSPRIKKFSSPKFFYIFQKNELVLSSPKQFSKRKIRVFRRGKIRVCSYIIYDRLNNLFWRFG